MFVLPPTFDELAQRLRKRGTETEAAIARGSARSRDEARAYSEYNYLIINRRLTLQWKAYVNRQRGALARGKAAQRFRSVEATS